MAGTVAGANATESQHITCIAFAEQITFAVPVDRLDADSDGHLLVDGKINLQFLLELTPYAQVRPALLFPLHFADTSRTHSS